ncbi:hypothetical protein CPC08DRAFT_716149 [Agrocybe pediades]|nr:hypothetical protein CPC08DRAFT_716149 [Agrocybe pediades]
MLASIHSTLGAGLIGNVVASILFGVSILQTYYYYVNFPKDWLFQKAAVGGLIALDATHLAVTTQAIYSYAISAYTANAGISLDTVLWSVKLQMLFNLLIVIAVQSLYAVRIWKLGGYFSRWCPIVVACFVLSGYAIGSILVYSMYQLETWDDLLDYSWAVYASLSVSTGIDIVLASAMCCLLRRSRSSFDGTNNFITRIIQYVLISGLLTGACSLAALITFATMPHNWIFYAISFLLTKLYVNSYISMLNSRQSTRESMSACAASTACPLMSLRCLKTTATNGAIIEGLSGTLDEKTDSQFPETTRSDEESSSGHGHRSVGHAHMHMHTLPKITVLKTEEVRYDDSKK